MANVRCYAGSRYPERPINFEWQGDWLDVVAVRRQARTPEGLVFDVLARGGQCYRLMWHQFDNAWTIAVAANTRA